MAVGSSHGDLSGVKPAQHFVHVEGGWGTDREARGSLRPSGRVPPQQQRSAQGRRALGVPRALAGFAVSPGQLHISAFIVFVYEHTKQNSHFG